MLTACCQAHGVSHIAAAPGPLSLGRKARALPMPEHRSRGQDRCLSNTHHLYPWLLKVGEVQVDRMEQLIL